MGLGIVTFFHQQHITQQKIHHPTYQQHYCCIYWENAWKVSRSKIYHATQIQNWRTRGSIPKDPTLHCVRGRHALCEVPTAVGHSSTRTTAKFLESQTLASQGLIAPFAPVGWAGPLRLCAIGGINIVEHHPHTRLSSGHGSDTTCCAHRQQPTENHTISTTTKNTQITEITRAVSYTHLTLPTIYSV